MQELTAPTFTVMLTVIAALQRVFLNYVLRYSNRNVYLCGKLMVNYESIQIHLRARWTA